MQSVPITTKVVSLNPAHGEVDVHVDTTDNEGGGGCVMVFNATFNNISVISWRSVLLVEDNRVHKENHRPAARDCMVVGFTTTYVISAYRH
jgi:hypothetical protein